MLNIACGCYLQALVTIGHPHPMKLQPIVIATHRKTEVERQREATEHWCKRARDILQIGRTGDSTSMETEGDTVFLAGQLHLCIVDMQLGALLLHHHIIQPQLLASQTRMGSQVADINARNGIDCLKVGQL